MASDPNSSHLPPNLDFDLLPSYTSKHPDSLTCSSPRYHTMADLYTTVTAYTLLVLILMCLISTLASMAFINLCVGGGSFAGTVPLAAGIGLLVNNYFRRGFPLHEEPPEDNPQVPHQWRKVFHYSLTIVLPFVFGILFFLVLQATINNCCHFIPAGYTSKPTASDQVPGAAC